MAMSRIRAVCFAALLLALPGHAQLDKILGGLGGQSDTKTAAA